MKTKFNSYTNNDMCRGCKLCLKGQKLVLFIGGKCSRNCWYCSLSEGRKNSNIMWANERPCETTKDIILEALDSNATGAGITGGDPLVYFNKTIETAKALKQKFGSNFHIHIYLPFPLVNKEKLTALQKYIDEVRFHASFIAENTTEKKDNEELEKLHLASSIFGKRNTGIELPLIPEKKQQIIDYIKSASQYISFANLNEFELSDTNFEKVTKYYTLNADTYTISKSIETGKEILKKYKKEKLKIHLCTASTKNHHQHHNRLLKHNILPYGIRTQDATVIYATIPLDKQENENQDKQTKEEKLRKIAKTLKQYTKKFHIDTKRNRILLDKNQAYKIYKTEKFNLYLSEEHPTFEAEKMSFWKLTDKDFE